MGTAAARAKLDTALEEAKPWSADGLFVDVQVLGPDRELVNQATRPASDTGCSKSGNDAKKRHESEFASRRCSSPGPTKLFLSDELNHNTRQGRQEVIALFDKCGGCARGAGGSRSKLGAAFQR
jgi:hypothetical protein